MSEMPAGLRIRVRGVVQGVGYRPWVWQLANRLGVHGNVWNDSQGVGMEVWAPVSSLETFLARLRQQAPPLARVDAVDVQELDLSESPRLREGFHILTSREGRVHTGIVADAATCAACLEEIFAPQNRRYRYPFTNCTHCGPRLSILRAIPYDRANTSMAVFPMCSQCREEYEDPGDRRFHAQPNACPDCGPRIWLEDADGRVLAAGNKDSLVQAARMLGEGRILVIKGIGGMHLACDAANEATVKRLRQGKQRHDKAFALMARHLDQVAEYVHLDTRSREALQSPAAPIVVLPASGKTLAPSVAPGQNTLGFMLPYTPLHHLLMAQVGRPLVMTSGNRSEEPQCTDNSEARKSLSGIVDAFLLHDRDIVTRLDDSVQRVMAGGLRTLRRARGLTPGSLRLPKGFLQAPRVLAMGAELKNSFCLLADGQAVVSQHIGDLEDAACFADYRHMLEHYARLFDFSPEVIAVDRHPDYLSSQWGRRLAADLGIPCLEVQHHHAHVAACLAETGMNAAAAPVIAVVLDGLGYGDDDNLWGGEFLLAGYGTMRRLAHFQAIAMPGGSKAIHEPWRNTFAHLHACLGWDEIRQGYGELELVGFLQGKPLQPLMRMMERGVNSPPASSAGRLFDAVAGALGICRESVSFEGQAAMGLEVLAELCMTDVVGYPVVHTARTLEWKSLWMALLEDLREGVEKAVIAARFHRGLADAIVTKIISLCKVHGVHTVVLTGGVFQNRLLLESVVDGLRKQDLGVKIPKEFPVNDGGIALGQATIVAKRYGD